MANFTLDQTGQEIQDILDTVGNNQATSGQVLTADGNGGASWQNAGGGTQNAVTLDADTQQFVATKQLNLTSGYNFIIGTYANTNKFMKYSSDNAVLSLQKNGDALVQLNANNAQLKLQKMYNNAILLDVDTAGQGAFHTKYGDLLFPQKAGTIALTSDIDAKVPDAPSTDGTYTLKCVVSNGGTTKTYQWVLDNQ